MKFLGNILFFLFILSTSTVALADSFIAIDYGKRPDNTAIRIVEHPARTDKVRIDPTSIKLAFAVESADPPATAATVLAWLKITNGQFLDAQVLNALLKHQRLIPESWKNYSLIYFFGTIFENDQGEQQIAYLRWDKTSWCFNYLPLNTPWKSTDRAAYID